ncbi:Chitinase A1 precursor [compost metagenome]
MAWGPAKPLGKVALHTEEGLLPGTLYTFAVTAVDASGNESLKSNLVNAIPLAGVDTTPPDVPHELTAVAGMQSIGLSWQAVESGDAAGYHVYTSHDLGVTWSSPPATVTGTTYSALNLEAGVPYTFTVTALDSSGNESAKSSPVTSVPLPGIDVTAPAAPVGLSAAAGAGQVDLLWMASSEPDLAGYRIHTSIDHGATWGPPSVTVTGTTYTVTQLTYGVTYTFAITALDLSGNESPKSSVVQAVPLAEPDHTAPAVPSELAASIVSGKVSGAA